MARKIKRPRGHVLLSEFFSPRGGAALARALRESEADKAKLGKAATDEKLGKAADDAEATMAGIPGIGRAEAIARAGRRHNVARDDILRELERRAAPAAWVRAIPASEAHPYGKWAKAMRGKRNSAKA